MLILVFVFKKNLEGDRRDHYGMSYLILQF
jgi:hypothetical protein